MKNEFSIIYQTGGLFSASSKVLAKLDTYEAAQLVKNQDQRCHIIQTQFGDTLEAKAESLALEETRALAGRQEVYLSLGAMITTLIICVVVWRICGHLG